MSAFSIQAASSNNLLARAAQLNEPPPELVRGLRTAEPDQISHYATWLDWLERSPQRLGRVNYRNEPLIAGSRQNIEVSFVPGTDIQPGGLLLVATHWQNGSLLQSVDPRAGNYVSARTSSAGVDLLPTQTLLRGVFGGRLGGRTVLAFEVTGSGLNAGEAVTFQIQNLQVPGRAGDFYLPVYFSTGSNQPLFSSPLTNLMIRPGQLASIEVTAPSRLGRGEAANVQVILQDQFGNPIQAALPSLDIIVDGVFLRRFDPPGARSEVSGIEFQESGIHSIEVRTGGGSSRGISNPIVVQSGTRQIRWADLNQQTVLPLSRTRQVENLDYRLRSFHGDDIDSQSKQKLGAEAVQIFDGGLRGGGSRLVFAQFDDVDNWRGLPDEMQMALPLVPTDDRTINSQKLQLVEMVSGDSVYEWFANRLFQAGYRLGLTGSGHSLLAPIGPYPRSALTAVVASGNQSTESALQQKSTYVTTGNRMVLHATVNGAQPGRRISSSQSRSIEGWVQGTAGIEQIELVKNGVVVETLNVAGDVSSPHLKVTVRSDSAPFQRQRDLPRNGREWIGYLKTSAATISEYRAPGFRNPARQAVARNGADRVDFITWTHGTESSFMVTLSSLVESEVIELNLRSGHEDFDLQPESRAPASIPPSRQMVPLFDLQAGPIQRVVKVDGYDDEIRFELVNPEAPDYVEFRFTDIAADETEDYYYIRVRQLDDHKAWSSPVFVGGFDAP